MEFWEILTRFAHPTTIASVHDMEEIDSDVGKVSDQYVRIHVSCFPNLCTNTVLSMIKIKVLATVSEPPPF